MASSLSDGNAIAFLAAFSREMPGYERLRLNVLALTQQAEVLSSIEPLGEEGGPARRSLAADWFIEVRPRQETGEVERRRRTLHLEIARTGRRWQVVRLDAPDFFAPPAAQ